MVLGSVGPPVPDWGLGGGTTCWVVKGTAEAAVTGPQVSTMDKLPPRREVAGLYHWSSGQYGSMRLRKVVGQWADDSMKIPPRDQVFVESSPVLNRVLRKHVGLLFYHGCTREKLKYGERTSS